MSDVNNTNASVMTQTELAKVMFEELQARFEKAHLPDFETEIKGWHVGRCFNQSGNLENTANLLVADTKPDTQSGPLGSTISKGFVGWWQDKPNDYFDQMTPNKSKEAQKFEDIMFSRASLTPVQAIGQSLAASILLDGGQHITNEFRTDGLFIYVKYQDNSDHLRYCYFYDKIE